MNPGDLVPLALYRCCRDWEGPAFIRSGSCGLCGSRPTFVGMLDESRWITIPPART